MHNLGRMDDSRETQQRCVSTVHVERVQTIISSSPISAAARRAFWQGFLQLDRW